MDKFFHSVYLVEENCTGCYNCIKRCPTQAIRVQDGKARVRSEYCIDCGECVRSCKQHAKASKRDKLKRDLVGKYEYLVALPSQALYSQFNNLDDVNILLTGLKLMGFNDVVEVSAASEAVTARARKYIEEHEDLWPIISTACPTVLRLIRVRFPNLIEHLLPMNIPAEVAARYARRKAMEETGLPSEKIGIVYISPCPSKVSYVQAPRGVEKSEIDEVLGIKDIYRILLPYLKEAQKEVQPLRQGGSIGIGWGRSGGEARALGIRDYIAADGILCVINVLEDLEDEKFEKVPFIELNACDGGCVGGVLNIENPFVARAKIMRFQKELPVTPAEELLPISEADAWWTKPLEYEPVYQLGSNFMESIAMMKKVDDLLKKFPGLDCGCCGAPSCKALAQDIVRGYATENACIHILKDRLHLLSQYAAEFANNEVVTKENMQEYIETTRQYINKMSNDIEALDNTIGVRGVHQRVEPETGSDLKPMPADD